MKRILLYLVCVSSSILMGEKAKAQITTFPYFQDFETFATCGGSCTSTCALQDGWINAVTATRDFAVDVNGTSSSQTGPTIDFSPGNSGGKYLYTEASSPCYPTSNWHLLAPTIDLTGTNDVQFTFWYHMYGQSMGMAHIDVSEDGGATWNLDVVPAWTDNQDLWQEKIVSLSAFTGIVTVRIRYENPSSFYGDFAIDAVHIFDLLQDDAGVVAFIDPAIPTCLFNDSVSISLMNFGTDTLFSTGVEWEWNAVVQTPIAWTGSLAPGQSEIVFLGTVSYGIGDNLKSWSTLPNGIIEFPSGNGNDTTTLNSIQTGLVGTYTIGVASPDYIDFNSAIADLNSFGVCGAVIFEVEDGVYNEQLLLGQVTGMNATNTVTFRSLSGDQTLVTISFAAALSNENYVIAFDDADYYNFEQMTIENTGVTYGRVLDYQGESEWNRIWDCHLNSTNTTTTSTNRSVIYSTSGNNNDNNWFVDNIIEGGSYGAYWYGVGTTDLVIGTVFDNNEFLNNYYYGSRLYYVENAVFTNNKTHGESTYTGTRFANYFYYCDGSFEVTGNEIYGGTTTGWYYGLYFGQSDGSPSSNALVANNMIQVGKTGTTSAMYGIYLTNSGFLDIHSNNVLVTEGGNSSRAFYATSGGATEVFNNNFINNTAGYGVYLSSSFSISGMDYNNIYSPLGNVGFYGSDQLTMADWQASSGWDTYSQNIDPMYASTTDLHICNDTLKGAGISHSLISEDFDGQSRSLNPDIGADEFTSLTTNFLGNDIELCVGDVVTLTAGAPSDTILWSTGDTMPTININTTGLYTVAINGVCGIGADTIDITMSNIVYTNFLTATDTLICVGDTAFLSSSMTADSYSWNTAETTPVISVTTSGIYTLDVSDGCGNGSEMININVLASPVAGFTYTSSYVSAIFTNTSIDPSNTYLWDFGDGTTSTEESPSHIFPTAGPYTVTLTVTNQCGADIYTSIVSMVGVDELKKEVNLSIFPNPSDGMFTISLTMFTQTEMIVTIENILGEVIYSSEMLSSDGNFSSTVNLSKESTGIYFVHLNLNGEQLSEKIIIK